MLTKLSTTSSRIENEKFFNYKRPKIFFNFFFFSHCLCFCCSGLLFFFFFIVKLTTHFCNRFLWAIKSWKLNFYVSSYTLTMLSLSFSLFHSPIKKPQIPHYKSFAIWGSVWVGEGDGGELLKIKINGFISTFCKFIISLANESDILTTTKYLTL